MDPDAYTRKGDRRMENERILTDGTALDERDVHNEEDVAHKPHISL